MSELKFCSSFEDATKGIDYAINVLTKWKKDITKENFSHFSISIGENRRLEPFYSVGTVGPIGFRQMSPITLTITVEDSQNLGKELIPNKGPWESPSPKDISDLNRKLSSRGKTKKWKKFQTKK
jgi:hypothetical protein